MEPEEEKTCENANSPSTPVEKAQTEVDNDTTINERTKATRHPRWTRWETLVLIEAKKVIENGGKRACPYASASGSIQFEPKWDLVSSFCEQQGVNRGPVQCRKRWSNLLSDFKKIQKWESDIKAVEAESFWVLRNDERKERKLPGFFDREVFNVLDGKLSTAAALPMARIKATSRAKNTDGEDDDGEDKEAEAIIDSEAMGWTWSKEEEINETKTSIKKVATFNVPGTKETIMASPAPLHDSDYVREPVSQERRKKKRLPTENYEDATNFSNQFIEVLRRNGDILNAQLGAQNMNHQMARDQQKEQSESLINAIGKLTDALIKIADKL